MLPGFQMAIVLPTAAIVGAFTLHRLRRPKRPAELAPLAPPTPLARTEIVRPNPSSVEGLEVRYGSEGFVRQARVGAMNSEHKELLLTLDSVRWSGMPTGQKQQVIVVARSTWASRMCPEGPDVAYVVAKTECGEIVGRADPHSVTVR